MLRLVFFPVYFCTFAVQDACSSQLTILDSARSFIKTIHGKMKCERLLPYQKPIETILYEPEKVNSAHETQLIIYQHHG